MFTAVVTEINHKQMEQCWKSVGNGAGIAKSEPGGGQSLEGKNTAKIAELSERTQGVRVAGGELKTPAGCTRSTEGAAERALDGQGWEPGGGGKSVFLAESSEHSLLATELSRKPSKSEERLNISSEIFRPFSKIKRILIL